MKNGLVELNTQPWAAEREWTADGIPVLHAVATLPRPDPVQGGVCRRIDRFYRLQSRAYLRYCERFLVPQARESAECPGIQRTLHPHGGGADIPGHL